MKVFLRMVLMAWAAGAVVASGRLAGETPQNALPAAAVAEIDALMQKEMQAAKVPGASLAIVWANTPVYAKGFGMADLENRVPVKNATAFRTASVAKPITATGVMWLVERGTLDLDAPIQKYCPAFPGKQWPVTARLLLGHQAGIRHYGKPGESAGTQHYFSIADSLALFKNDPLLHEPGTKYLYTTFGYSVLGCAIEGASGQPYETFMREKIFTPAGMTHTRLDRIWDIIPDRSRGYMLLTADAFKTLPPTAQAFARVDTVYNAPFHDTSMKIPGGGLVSTSEDLTRFGIAVMTHTILKESTQEQMWTDGATKDGKPTGYGLGWGVTPRQDGIRRLTHSGNQIGGASVFHVLPEIGLSYAIMVNLEDTEMGPMSRGVAQVLRKHLMGK
jgi:CubicO group peptidase (beta-lactamase class C family)